MYFLNKFCCICMNKSDLKHIFDVDNHGVSHYNKLTSSVAEIHFKEMNDQRLICGECCDTLNTVYNFRQTCLRSKTNLITYISQLQTSSHVTGTIKIKKEIDIECENEGDSFENVSNSHFLLKIKSDPDDISASNICCICMNKSDLKHLFDVDNDGVSHYNKLTLSVAEMQFKELNDQKLICGECCVTLNTVYNFRQTCLRGKTNLITYISQLQTYSHVSGTLSIRLKETVHDIMVVKKEIEIKRENENIVEENHREFQTESYEDRIHFTASVKKELESEEEASFAHEEATADHLNASYVKVEDVEQQTMMDDKAYTECTEIDIQDPLTEVKEEPMSDTETPDGSIRADTGSSEPKKSEGTAVGTERARYIQRGPHKCEICGARFTVKKFLTNHLKLHKSKCLYECEICKKNVSRKYDLKVHMRIHSGERPFECKICKKNFICGGSLNAHAKIHGERTFQCEICNKSYPLKKNLDVHMKMHSGERPYECEVCHKTFVHKGHLKDHAERHGTKSFECEICKKGYPLKKFLDAHMKTHSGEKKYECEVCKKSFVFKEYLNQHKKIHSTEVRYECEICHKSFVHKGHLNEHSKIHGESAFECEICKKRFPLKRNLDVHMTIHSGERKHECEICKKSFRHKCSLTQHMKLHSGAKPYECEICHKKIVQRSNFNDHVRIHGERPHVCKICKKGFTLKRFLDIHMKTHSGERNHECEICKKTFPSKNYLRQHMGIHSNVKPYECEICKKTFRYQSSHYQHMRIHSGEKPYECEICHKKFSYRSHYTDHMGTHNKNPFNCDICKKGFLRKTYFVFHMKKHGERKQISEIYIKEEPLTEVKKEPMSDSETPQDGSTSQADTGTSEEPKKIEETAIKTEPIFDI